VRMKRREGQEGEQKELRTAYYEDEGVGREGGREGKGERERVQERKWVEGMGKGIGKARGIKINRKRNVREGKKELLHLFCEEEQTGDWKGREGWGRMVG
jgi:hypothetical protein